MPRQNSRPAPLLGRVLKKIAPSLSASVHLEPSWKVAGQIRFKNGRVSYFRYNTVDVNPLGASEIAKDKDYASFFMNSLGYPTVAGKTFFSDSWAKTIGSTRTKKSAYAYAKRIGFPVYVKPNSGSHGRDVTIAGNKIELFAALKQIFLSDPVALVQRPVQGKDYRVLVYKGKVICAYERIPLFIEGDGVRSVKTLLAQKLRTLKTPSGGKRIHTDDSRIHTRLAREHIPLAFVPKKGERILLLDNANLSSGGTAKEVTAVMHPAWKKGATSLTREMGLVLCGVDFIIDGDITKPPKRYWVLEVNASPGVEYYAQLGPRQMKIVLKLYAQILKSLSKKV